MVKSKQCFSILLFFITTAAFAQIDSLKIGHLPDLSVRRSQIDVNEFFIPSVRNKAFNVGEELVFDVKYGLIKAGTAKMCVTDTQLVSGRPCYKILTTAKSTNFISKFYKVRDTVAVFIDMDGIFPWYFEKHINEGKYHTDRYIDFRQRENIAIYKKIRRKKKSTRTKIDTASVPRYVQGVLSAFYNVRTRNLEVGKSFELMVYGDGRLYPLRVLVHRREKVKVPAGKFKCIVIEPILMSEGIFKQDGKLTIWLSDDERKIPVLMKSKVAIGSIDCRLRKYRFSSKKD
ncbi:DUF3108 domain-containing protein [bacterium]|nr:DUF3108 domain-containing protein [bacterium]